MADSPSLDSPYQMLGGTDAVLALARRFYEVMDRDEPELARLHHLDENGRVAPAVRERFALFLVGWMGGPQDYMEKYGHPRLRLRHARVPVDTAMRDAWLRCMARAMDDCGVTGRVRAFLDERFAEVASFLRNTPA